MSRRTARSAVGPSPNTISNVVSQRAAQAPERIALEVAVLRDALRDVRMGDLEQQRCRACAEQHGLAVDAPHLVRGP